MCSCAGSGPADEVGVEFLWPAEQHARVLDRIGPPAAYRVFLVKCKCRAERPAWSFNRMSVPAVLMVRKPMRSRSGRSCSTGPRRAAPAAPATTADLRDRELDAPPCRWRRAGLSFQAQPRQGHSDLLLLAAGPSPVALLPRCCSRVPAFQANVVLRDEGRAFAPAALRA